MDISIIFINAPAKIFQKQIVFLYQYQHQKGADEILNLEIVGQGATTTIYRDGNTAIKLYVNAPHNEAENEAERQQLAYNAGLPVPAVYGIRRLDDKTVALDMEYINGKPIMHHGMDKDERRNAINIMAKLQCTVHRVQASTLTKQADMLQWKIKNTKHIASPIKEKLLSFHKTLDDGFDCFCHGDFHPLNILYDGCRYWIIDWVDAAVGSPLADACRTYMIFEQHMKRSAGIYLRAFCKEAKLKQDDVLAWQPIIAAARLDENMDDKSREWLISIVQKWIDSTHMHSEVFDE